MAFFFVLQTKKLYSITYKYKQKTKSSHIKHIFGTVFDVIVK